MERITESDITVVDCIYRVQNKVEVYKVRLLRTGEFLCMKKLFVENVMDATFIQSEFIFMASLQHPNIIRLRSAGLGGRDREISYVLIFMEFFEEGDLERLIQSKIKENSFIPEQEIITWLTELVKAFAYMQERTVAHRDIKPQNIFLYRNPETKAIIFKVGDLGSAIKKEGNTATLMGTPMYLSPKLRQAFSTTNYDSFNVEHDLYKSDVYSLGLTFLYMASLTSVKDLCSLQDLDRKIDLRIEALSGYYPRLIGLLKLMLNVDEYYRPNFLELKAKLESNVEVMSFDSKKEKTIGRGFKIEVLSSKCGFCLNEYSEDRILVFNNDLICINCFENFKSKINKKNNML